MRALLPLLAAVLAACGYQEDVTLPTAAINTSGAVTDAFAVAAADGQVLRIVGPGALPYRAASEDSQIDLWHLSYYAPSQQKSYAIIEQTDHQILAISEIADPTQRYRQGYAIDTTRIHQGKEQAKAAAIAAARANLAANVPVAGGVLVGAAPGTNLNAATFSSTTLISAQECLDETHKSADAPVYVIKSAPLNIQIYVSANDAAILASTAAPR